MRNRAFALVSIALWAVLIAGGAWLFFSGYTRDAPDGRTAVLLTPTERRMVLREMRQMLGSVQGVLAGMAADDMAAVAEAAGRSATVKAKPSPSMLARLPQDFLQRGMAVHENFGTLAGAAREGAAENALQQQLADVLAQCVACHAVYSVGVGDAAAAAGGGASHAVADTGCAAEAGAGAATPAESGPAGCSADLGAVDIGKPAAAQ